VAVASAGSYASLHLAPDHATDRFVKGKGSPYSTTERRVPEVT